MSATTRIFVAAAPVKVKATAPLVVSADMAKAHPGALLIAVTVDETRTTLAALFERLANASIFHAATLVLDDSVLVATTMPEIAKALKFLRESLFKDAGAEPFVVS